MALLSKANTSTYAMSERSPREADNPSNKAFGGRHLVIADRGRASRDHCRLFLDGITLLGRTVEDQASGDDGCGHRAGDSGNGAPACISVCRLQP